MFSWRAHANLLWRNWLNWVYQTTPYDLRDVPQLRAEKRLGTDRSIRHAPGAPRGDGYAPLVKDGYGLIRDDYAQDERVRSATSPAPAGPVADGADA